MKKKVLFITTQFPYPAYGGGKLVTLQHLNLLLKNYHVDLVCKVDSPPDENTISAFKQDFKVGKLILIPHWIKTRQNPVQALKSFIKSSVKHIPYKIYKYYNAKAEDRIDHLVASGMYNLLVYDQLPAFQHTAFERAHPRQVVFAHNAEYETVFTYMQTQKNALKRHLLSREAKRLENFERRVYRHVGNVVFISHQDMKKFPETKHALALPAYAGIFQTSWDKAFRQMTSPATLFLVASWTWALNREGLLWFTSEVIPRLTHKVEIYIAGTGIKGTLKKQLEKTGCIRVLGGVHEIRPHYLSSHMAIVPLFGGSGIKIKIVDAMAHGIPVVTTSFGVQGIEAFSKDICVADTPIDFARYIDTLIENPTFYREKQEQIRRDFQALNQQPVGEVLQQYLHAIAP